MKIFLLVSIFIFAVICAPITNLPGYNGPKLNMDSGYINVDPVHGRNLFYWLIEAEVDPDNKPLVMWLNGGPGCSSLGGLFQENGPLMVDSNLNVVYRDIAYTKVANMLYVESPAGVGFSYSNDKNDYNTNDTRAANDNYRFIQNFMNTFPKYSTRDFWLAGESYAGVYIPTLTELILSNSSSAIYKQYQGFTAGNPATFCKSADLISDINVQNEILYWHGLVSYQNYDQWNKLGCRTNYTTSQCQTLSNLIVQQVGVIDQELFVPNQNQPDLDPDDLYQDFCTGNGTLSFATNSINWPACNDNTYYLTTYLNRADVQQAIHAIRITDWTICTNNINYTISFDSMVPLYAKFPQQKPGLKILVYSGDIDIMTVPFPYTQRCLNELQRPTVSAWQPWYVNTAHAGYVEYHDTYTFATIKGAGHEAPQYQTLIAQNMFSRFITRQNLTDITPRPLVKPRQRITQSKWLRKIIQNKRNLAK